MKSWRLVSLLVLFALWVPSHFSTPSVAAFAQNSTVTTANSPPQNNAASSSNTTTQGTTSTSQAEPLRGPVQPVPFSHK